MTDLLGDPAGFVARLLLQIPALLIAVTIHELAHGLVADRLGDPTARIQGRLTLNPLPHIDPLGAIAFIIAGFGWAKPVPVNAYNLKHPRRDMAWIAAAGPISNFLLAFVGIVALVLVNRHVQLPFLTGPLVGGTGQRGILWWVFLFNLNLGIFNLIPLPPLDGGHFLPYLLPRRSWSFLHQLEQYGPFILILLVMTRAIDVVMGPVSEMMVHVYAVLLRLIL